MGHRPCGSRPAAVTAAARPLVQSEEESSADAGENIPPGHEEQQAQELLRAQKSYLQRKATRKEQRQQRRHRGQVLQKGTARTEQQLQKQLEQLHEQRQQQAGQRQRDSGHRQQRQQQDQQASSRYQQRQEEKQPQQRWHRSVYGKDVDEVVFPQKRRKGYQQGHVGHDTVSISDKGVIRGRLKGQAHLAGSENRFSGKQSFERRIVSEEVHHRRSACCDTVVGSSCEEQEEERVDRKRKSEMYSPPSCTDEYVLPREAKNRRKLQAVLRDGEESTLLRSEDMRQQRLQDEKELLYLERQLGFSAPGISEEKRKKMISKELASLGFDDDFMECLDTTHASPRKLPASRQQVRQQHLQQQQDDQQKPEQEERHYAGQLRGSEGEGRIYKTKRLPLGTSSGVDTTTKTKCATRRCAAGERTECVDCRDGSCAHQDEAEEQNVGPTNEKDAGHTARAAAVPLLTRDATVTSATTDPASRARRVLSESATKAGTKGASGRPESRSGKRAPPGVTKQLSLSAAADELAEQLAYAFDCANSFAPTGFHLTEDLEKEHAVKEQDTEATSDNGAKERRRAAASEVNELRENAGTLTKSSDESVRETSEERGSGGHYYIPPHTRRRLQLEKYVKEQKQQADGCAVHLAAHDAAEGLQLRLRGLLNRASEGNVELVLQQMVATIKETSSQLSNTSTCLAFFRVRLRECGRTLLDLLQLASSVEKEQHASGAEQKKQQQLRRVHEYFLRRVCEAVAKLFIENAIENKFSVAALIATQTALCCSLSVLVDTQLMRCFLEALGRCFCRHYRTSLLLDSSSDSESSESKNGHNGTVCWLFGESSSDVASRGAGKEVESGKGTETRGHGNRKGLRDGEQNAVSTAAMYTRHVVAAICFLFDYGALPATVYLQLLQRLTVTQAPEGRTQERDVQSLTNGNNDRTIDSGVSTSSATSNRESTVASPCAAGKTRRTTTGNAVLSEFQVECLLLALRLGGRRLRSESPELFREAWIHLMAQATPVFHAEHISPALHAASAFPDGDGWTAEPAGGRAAASNDVLAEGPHEEQRENDNLQQLKLRFQQRAAAQPATETLLHHPQAAARKPQAVTATNGRLRFLVHELQDLKNNKSNSCVLSSSAAAQETMRRWLQTSPTLRTAASLGASSTCCAALLENLEGITWKVIEEGSVNHLASARSSLSRPSAGGRRECVSATPDTVPSASQATAAAAAVLRELDSCRTALGGAGEVTTSSHRQGGVAKLAAKLRIHTENQKTIFSSLMSASDPNDAVQRLVQMPRHAVNPKQQVVDVVAVVLHSCLQEKMFNPFYAILLARLCGHCCCESRAVRLQSADEKTTSANRDASKAHLNVQGLPVGNSARKSGMSCQSASVSFSTCALPAPAGTRDHVAVEKLLTGCRCYTLPQKEAVKYTRVLQRGVAAQTSAAHAFPLRRLLHLAKLEAFLIRLGILELRLIRFLNFDEAAKEPNAGHMGLAGKFGAFLKELCTELLCDQSQASVPLPRASRSSPDASASIGPATPSPLPPFFSVCNLPDIREALLSVLQQASAETRQLKASTASEKKASCHGRRLSTAVVERVIWLLKEAPFGAGGEGIGGLPD